MTPGCIDLTSPSPQAPRWTSPPNMTAASSPMQSPSGHDVTPRRSCSSSRDRRAARSCTAGRGTHRHGRSRSLPHPLGSTGGSRRAPRRPSPLLSDSLDRVVVDSTGVVTEFGRRQRLFTGAAREAAKFVEPDRTHGCSVRPTFTQVDRIDNWSTKAGPPINATPTSVAARTTVRTPSPMAIPTRPARTQLPHPPDGTIVLPVGEHGPTSPTNSTASPDKASKPQANRPSPKNQHETTADVPIARNRRSVPRPPGPPACLPVRRGRLRRGPAGR